MPKDVELTNNIAKTYHFSEITALPGDVVFCAIECIEQSKENIARIKELQDQQARIIFLVKYQQHGQAARVDIGKHLAKHKLEPNELTADELALLPRESIYEDGVIYSVIDEHISHAQIVKAIAENMSSACSRLICIDDNDEEIDAYITNREQCRDQQTNSLMANLRIIHYAHNPCLISSCPMPGKDFNEQLPHDLTQLKYMKTLDGSSGGIFVLKHKQTDKLYTLKFQESASNMAYEIINDALYRSLGVLVPNFAVFDSIPTIMAEKFNIKNKGLFRLAHYIDSHPEYSDRESDDFKKKCGELASKNYVVDAWLANYDVNNRNVIIDPRGNLWRIDNGAGIRRKAGGVLRHAGYLVNEFDQKEFTNGLYTKPAQPIITAQADSLAARFRDITSILYKYVQILQLPDSDETIKTYCDRLKYIIDKFATEQVYIQLDHSQVTHTSKTDQGHDIFNYVHGENKLPIIDTPNKIRGDIAKYVMSYGGVLTALKQKHQQTIHDNLAEVSNYAGDKLSQSQIHMNALLDGQCSADLATNVDECIKALPEHLHGKASDNKELLLKMLEKESQHQEMVALYHAADSRTAAVYYFITCLRNKLHNINADTSHSFRLDKQLQKFNNIRELDAICLEHGVTNNYMGNYQVFAMSCNLFLFGNHATKTSCSLHYWLTNYSTRPPDVSVIVREIIDALCIEDESIVEQVIALLLTASEEANVGVMYQVFAPQEMVKVFSRASGTEGRQMYINANHVDTTDIVDILSEISKQPNKHRSEILELQARLYPKLDSSLSKGLITYQYRNQQPSLRTEQAMAKMVNDIVSRLLRFPQNACDVYQKSSLAMLAKNVAKNNGLELVDIHKERALARALDAGQLEQAEEILIQQPGLRSDIVPNPDFNRYNGYHVNALRFITNLYNDDRKKFRDIYNKYFTASIDVKNLTLDDALHYIRLMNLYHDNYEIKDIDFSEITAIVNMVVETSNKPIVNAETVFELFVTKVLKHDVKQELIKYYVENYDVYDNYTKNTQIILLSDWDVWMATVDPVDLSRMFGIGFDRMTKGTYYSRFKNLQKKFEALFLNKLACQFNPQRIVNYRLFQWVIYNYEKNEMVVRSLLDNVDMVFEMAYKSFDFEKLLNHKFVKKNKVKHVANYINKLITKNDTLSREQLGILNIILDTNIIQTNELPSELIDILCISINNSLLKNSRAACQTIVLYYSLRLYEHSDACKLDEVLVARAIINDIYDDDNMAKEFSLLPESTQHAVFEQLLLMYHQEINEDKAKHHDEPCPDTLLEMIVHVLKYLFNEQYCTPVKSLSKFAQQTLLEMVSEDIIIDFVESRYPATNQDDYKIDSIIFNLLLSAVEEYAAVNKFTVLMELKARLELSETTEQAGVQQPMKVII